MKPLPHIIFTLHSPTALITVIVTSIIKKLCNFISQSNIFDIRDKPINFLKNMLPFFYWKEKYRSINFFFKEKELYFEQFNKATSVRKKHNC